jgi:hypothetical protein
LFCSYLKNQTLYKYINRVVRKLLIIAFKQYTIQVIKMIK